VWFLFEGDKTERNTRGHRLLGCSRMGWKWPSRSRGISCIGERVQWRSSSKRGWYYRCGWPAALFSGIACSLLGADRASGCLQRCSSWQDKDLQRDLARLSSQPMLQHTASQVDWPAYESHLQNLLAAGRDSDSFCSWESLSLRIRKPFVPAGCSSRSNTCKCRGRIRPWVGSRMGSGTTFPAYLISPFLLIVWVFGPLAPLVIMVDQIINLAYIPYLLVIKLLPYQRLFHQVSLAHLRSALGLRSTWLGLFLVPF